MDEGFREGRRKDPNFGEEKVLKGLMANGHEEISCVNHYIFNFYSLFYGIGDQKGRGQWNCGVNALKAIIDVIFLLIYFVFITCFCFID